jgi:hypothetical protein
MNLGSQAEIWSSPPAIRCAWRLRCIRALALLLIALMSGSASFAHSVLTHEPGISIASTRPRGIRSRAIPTRSFYLINGARKGAAFYPDEGRAAPS